MLPTAFHGPVLACISFDLLCLLLLPPAELGRFEDINIMSDFQILLWYQLGSEIGEFVP